MWLRELKHLALAGLTKTVLDNHDDQLKRAIEAHYGAAGDGRSSKTNAGGGAGTYTLLAKHVLGAIALLVYSNDETVTRRVERVDVASAATGIARVMGNKGGVGVRVTLSSPEGDDVSDGQDGETFTFVTAHLAAHDKGLQRRNQDYRAICERLVFTGDRSGKFSGL